jgi:hypothetical protein
MDANELVVDGRRFELTLLHTAGACHWLLADPGKIVLSGEEADADAAWDAARIAARSWLEERRAGGRDAAEQVAAFL